jgi:hypothetical protein
MLRFPGRRHPIQWLEHRLLATRNVTLTGYMKAGSPRTVRTPANEWGPWRSSCSMKRESELSQSTPRRSSWQWNVYIPLLAKLSLFPDNRPPRMQFCGWLRQQHLANEIFLHKILWRDEACVKHEDVLEVHNIHLWARNNRHATLSTWVSSPLEHQHLSFDRRSHLQADCIVIFWKVFYWGCLKMCISVAGSGRRSSNWRWGRRLVVVERDRQEGVLGVEGRLLGRRIKLRLIFPWRTTFMQSLQRLSHISWQDFKKIWHVRENAVCRSHSYLPWRGQRQLRKTILTTRCLWFDHLIVCAIRRWLPSLKLEARGHCFTKS